MPQTNIRNCLSKHDQQVLDSIFNPLELTSSLNAAIDPDTNKEIIDIEEETEEVLRSKTLEIDAIQLAEQGDLGEALKKFEQALQVAPKRASIFNNRAQVLRLAGKDDDAFADLDKALEFSSEQPKTKCHALCQRGVLNRKREKLDEARLDFEGAAQLGSKFAREQLVEINPFAALCNQMLRQAFDQLK